MSNPITPVQADPQSLRTVRLLLERNILDRAVAIAESRWPGSGPLVQLAHEWSRLTPADRRERLADIGPEELSRLRAVAELQPDLARVLSDLEARGAIPPATEVAYDHPGSGSDDAERDTLEVNEAPNYVDTSDAPLRTSEPQRRASDGPTRTVEPAGDVVRGIGERSVEAVQAAGSAVNDFLVEEQDRRARLAAEADKVLDRVRERIDQNAGYLSNEMVLPEPGRAHRSTDSADGTPAGVLDASGAARPDQAGRARLVERISEAQVTVIEQTDGVPERAEIEGAARALNLGLIELSTEHLDVRSFFGGLVRSGHGVVPQAGAFPAAVAGANLVVVRGRVLPKLITRLRAGYCDIPGTNATVRVHPKARIVVITT